MKVLTDRFTGLILGWLLLLVLVSCGGEARPDVSVSLSPSRVLLAAGESQEFTAAVSGGGDASVIWETSAGGLVTNGSTVLYTAPEMPGRYTLTATSAEAPNASATASVTVAIVESETQETISHDGGEVVAVDDAILRLGSGVLAEDADVRMRAYQGWTDDYPGGLNPVGPMREFFFASEGLLNGSSSSLLGNPLVTQGVSDPFNNRVLVSIPFPEGLPSNGNYLVDVTINAGGEPFSYPDVYYPDDGNVIEISMGLLRALLFDGGSSGEFSITTQLVQVDEFLSPAANVPHKGLFAITTEFSGLSSLGAACPGNAKESLPAGIVRAGDEHLDGRMPLVLITGWQTINNMTTGWKTMPWNKQYVPQVCGWKDFLHSFAREDSGVYDNPGELTKRYAVFTYGYDSDLSIADNGLALKSELEEYFGDREIVILAHSMGGLLTNYAVNAAGLDNVSHAIALGTPFRGTTLIHCVATTGGGCSKVKLNPRIMAELNDICNEMNFFAATTCKNGYALVRFLVAKMASRQGDRDLAWQYGGAHNEWAYHRCDGEFQICATSIQTVPNPRLEQLNYRLKQSNVSQFIAFVGDIPATHDSEMYGTIAALLLLGDNQQSDGITPIGSGCLSTSQVDNTCRNSIIPNANVHKRSLTHTELSGAPNYREIRELLLGLAPDRDPPREDPKDPPKQDPEAPPKEKPAAFTLQAPKAYCTASNQPAVGLQWSESARAQTYEVHRNGSHYATLDTITPRYDNTANVAAGTTYEYIVRARNSAGYTDTLPRSVLIPSDVCDSGNPPSDPAPGLGALSITPATGFSAESVIGELPRNGSVNYTLSNTGTGKLDWSVNATVNWLTVTPESGSLEPSESSNVRVRFNVAARNLPPGDHHGSVVFSADGPISGSGERTVSLSLDDLPPDPTVFSELEAMPASIAFHADVGERPDSRVITLTNRGQANSSYQTTYPGWLSISPRSGSLASGRSVNVNVNPMQCDRRETLTGLIQFRDDDSLVNVSVSMECSDLAPTTGTLRISTSGVPSGFRKAFGTVTGPDRYYEEVDVANLSLTVPAGSYTVKMDGFRYGNDRYFPDISSRTVQVNANRSTQVSFQYVMETPTPPLPRTELLKNRSFDGASSWTVNGDAWVWNGGSESKYRTAPGYAALGVDWDGYVKSGASGEITQEVVIPAGATSGRVSFYYQMDVINEGYGGQFTVALKAGRCSSYALTRGGRALLPGDAHSSYTFVQSQIFDVVDLVGDTVCFRLDGGTATPGQIVFRADDVSLEVWGD